MHPKCSHGRASAVERQTHAEEASQHQHCSPKSALLLENCELQAVLHLRLSAPLYIHAMPPPMFLPLRLVGEERGRVGLWTMRCGCRLWCVGEEMDAQDGHHTAPGYLPCGLTLCESLEVRGHSDTHTAAMRPRAHRHRALALQSSCAATHRTQTAALLVCPTHQSMRLNHIHPCASTPHD